MTPGDYLALRREAAGLSVADVAWMVASKPADRRVIIDLIGEWEADLSVPSPAYVRTLQNAFPFDPYILRQLIAGIGEPELCRACGCSALDPCDHERLGTCAWATPDHDLCTTCAIRGAKPRGA